MENILEVKKITKEYNDFKLNNVSFNVPKGSIVGFIGENGAGKTTTIKIILDIIKSQSGEVKILDKEYEEVLSDDIGIVLDKCCFPETLTLNEINKVMKKIYKRWDGDRFIKLSKELNIPSAKKVSEMSKGTQMKLSIITALAHKPKLLILDEATGGLDPVVRDNILEMFLEFIQDEEHGILMSSHIVSDLEKACDYIVFIHEGKIIFNEEKDMLFEKYGILKCSEGDLESIDKNAIVKVKKNSFGVEALVFKDKIKGNRVIDKASIEEIMLYYIK